MTVNDDLLRRIDLAGFALVDQSVLYASPDAFKNLAAVLRTVESLARETKLLEDRTIAAEADAATWKRELEMYDKAWLRELGGKLIPKSHRIDALALTTELLRMRADSGAKAELQLLACRAALRRAKRGLWVVSTSGVDRAQWHRDIAAEALMAVEKLYKGDPEGDMAGPRIHELKTENPGFTAIIEGKKTHEVRKDDRDYAIDDFLHLREYACSATPCYLGREAWVRVTYKSPGGSWGLPPDLCVLSVERCEAPLDVTAPRAS